MNEECPTSRDAPTGHKPFNFTSFSFSIAPVGAHLTFGKIMTPKKLLLPPLVPVALLLLLCAWVFVSEATGDVRMIEGRPDNAPARASVILAMLSPLVYVLFGIFNLIDATLDRFGTTASWIGTAALIIVVGLLLSRGFYAPHVDSSPAFAVAAGFGVSLAMFAPMSAIRRCAIRNSPKSKNTEQDVPPNA